jgi:hypothetical protein
MAMPDRTSETKSIGTKGKTKHMENRIKTSHAGLKAQAVNAAAGLAEYAVALNLGHISDAILNAKVSAFDVADVNYKRAKTTMAIKKEEFEMFKETARIFGFTGRDVLKPHLGKVYSPKWDEPGYYRSLAVPTNTERLIQLMLDMKNYFTAHPTHENPALTVTAAQAEAQHLNLTDTFAAYNAQKATVKGLLDIRTAKADDIAAALRGLLKSLAAVLAPMDARWLAFGFNLPGLKATPDVPENVIATVQLNKVVALRWNAAARASTYRIWKKVAGIDEDFILVDSRTDLDMLIEGLPVGATIELAVSASNTGGESARSTAVTVMIAA